MMITDFSFCSGVASLGSDCMLSWSLWMFRWFWIVNHQNCCSNNSSFMAGRVKHLCQEWSITIWLVLIKFWQVPWNVRLREWPIIGNGEAICVQVNTTWLIVTMCCHGYKISAFEHFHVNSRFRLSTDGSGLGKRFSRYADDQSVPWRLIYACFKLQFAHKSKFYKTSCRYLAYSTLSYLKSYWEEWGEVPCLFDSELPEELWRRIRRNYWINDHWPFVFIHTWNISLMARLPWTW